MRLPLWRHVRQRLSAQVVVVMVAILLLTVVGGFVVMYQNTSGQLNDQFEHRSLSIAQTLAGEQNVVALAADGRPGGQLQVLASQVLRQTGALFVVITNAQGIRLTHPNPALIGTPVTYDDPEPATSEPFRTGQAWLGLQHGTLGPVAAGKTPLWLNGTAGRRGLGRLPGREGQQRAVRRAADLHPLPARRPRGRRAGRARPGPPAEAADLRP